MTPADGLADLDHDHDDLTERVRSVAALVRGLVSGDEGGARATVAAEIDELREEIFIHFAREEEGLFAFATTRMVGFDDEVTALLGAHDAVCGAIVRLLHALRGGGGAQGKDALPPLLERFEAAYAAHAVAERELLRRLAGSMSVEQRAELAALVRAL